MVSEEVAKQCKWPVVMLVMVEACGRINADVRAAITSGMLTAVPPKCSQQPISIPALSPVQPKYILPRGGIFRTDKGLILMRRQEAMLSKLSRAMSEEISSRRLHSPSVTQVCWCQDDVMSGSISR